MLVNKTHQRKGVRKGNKNLGFLLFFVILFVAFVGSVLLGGRVSKTASPPSVITYQGKLLENSASVTTTKAIAFLIYDASSGGNLLYTASGTIGSTTTVSVTPTNGVFSVNLGGTGTNSLDPDLLKDNASLYLEVIVDGTTLTPRKQLTAAPYALNSKYLDGYGLSTASTSTYIPLSDSEGGFTFGTTTITESLTVSTTATSSISFTSSTLFQSSAAADESEVFMFDTSNTITSGNLLSIRNNGTTRLFVDESGNLGVNTSTAGYTLTVEGNTWLSTTTYVMGNFFNASTSEWIYDTGFIMNGDDAYFADDVGVGGNFYTNGVFNAGTTLSMAGCTEGLCGDDYLQSTQNLLIDADGTLKLNTTNNGAVQYGNGAVTFGSGMVTVGDDITVTGDTNLSGGLYVTGTAIFGTALVRTGDDMVVGDDLDVAGNLSVSGTVDFGTGMITAGDDLTVAGDLNVTGGLYVTGTSIFGSALVRTGDDMVVGDDLDVAGNLTVTGTSHFASTLSASSTVNITGTTTLSNLVDLQGKVGSPVHAGSLVDGTNMQSPFGVHVKGDYAYVVAYTSNKFHVIDISDPSNIAIEGTLSDGGSALLDAPTFVYVEGDYAYITVNNDDAITIVDVSDPANPVHVSSLARGTGIPFNSPRQIKVYGNYAYVSSDGSTPADQSDAFSVVDITDPYDPKVVGYVLNSTYLGDNYDFDIQGNYAYVVAYGSSRLTVIDISDPTNPIIVGSLADGGGGTPYLNAPIGIDVQGNYAYIAALGSDAFEVVDISDPTNPTHFGSIVDATNLNNAYSVFVSGDYAYVTANAAGAMTIIDISDPSTPVRVSTINDGDGGASLTGARIVQVQGNYAYVTASTDNALEVIDVSGVKISNADVGTLKTANIEVSSRATFNEGVSVRGGLNVGASGLLLSGDFGMSVPTSTTATSTATNTLRFSHTTLFKSNAHSGETDLFIFDTKNTIYDGNLLSVKNNGSTEFFITEDGKVGINTASADYNLTVNGTAYISNTGYVMRDFYVASTSEWIYDTGFIMNGDDAYFADDVGVGGNFYTNGVFNAGTTLSMAGCTEGLCGDDYLNSTQDLVIDSDGTLKLNTTNNGAVQYGNGAVTFGSGMVAVGDDITVTGDTNLSGGLYVTGTAIFGSALVRTGDDVAVGGDLDVAGNLSVTGTVSFGGGVTYTDTLNASGTVNISGATNISNQMDLIGKVGTPTHSSIYSVASLGPYGIAIAGDYAYIASYGASKFRIVDISDPTSSSTLVGTLDDNTGGSLLSGIYEVKVSGNYAYAVSEFDDALEIIDITDPTTPVHKGSIVNGAGGAQLNGPRGLFISGNYAYVASYTDDALEIIDISDPANPVHAGSVSDGGGSAPYLNGPYSVYVSGNYAYVASEVSGALEVVDITDPTNPTHAGSLTDGGAGAPYLSGATTVFVQGNYAYVGAYSDNALQVVDISDPTTPTAAGSIVNGAGGALLGGVFGVYVSGNYAYVAAGTSNALEIVDITDPNSPVHRGSLANGSGGAHLSNPQEVIVHGNYAYVASYGSDALEVINVTGADISNAEIGTARVSNMQVMSNAMFDQSVNVRGGLSVGNSGLLLSGSFGMSVPTSTTATSTATNTLNFSHTALFESSADSGETEVFIFDTKNTIYDGKLLSVKNNGTQKLLLDEAGNLSINTSTSNYALTVEGTSRFTNTAYVMADLYAGSTADAISTTTFTMDGDDAYVHDLLGVGDSLYVENEIHLETGGKGLHFTPYGSVVLEGGNNLVIDASGYAINMNTNGNGSVSFGTGMVTAGDDITVAGDTNLSGGLYVTGTAIFGNALVRTGDDVAVGGDLDVAGNLTVTGTVDFGTSATLNSSSTVNITGTTTIANRVDIQGLVGAPKHESNISTASTIDPNAIDIQGDYLYVVSEVSDALSIIDISNPGSPTEVGSINSSTPNTYLDDPEDVVVQGNYAYIVSSGGTDGLEIVDISDPVNPTHKGALPDNAGGARLQDAQAIYVSGNYAYILSYYDDALEIVDISDPSSPKHIGFTADGIGGAQLNGPYNLVVSGDYAYITSYESNVLEVIDVSDPYNPKHAGSLADGAGGTPYLNAASNIFIEGNYAYITSYSSDALEIVDISNPKNPTHVGSLVDGTDLNGARGIYKSGNYVYIVSLFSATLQIIDVSDPVTPVFHGEAVSGQGGVQISNPKDVMVAGSHVYVVTNGAYDAVEIINIGAADISNAQIGTAKVSNMQVMSHALFDQSVNVRGGLSVGNSGLLLTGDFGMSTATGTDSTTATNTLSFSNTVLFKSHATATEDEVFVFDTGSTISSGDLLAIKNNGTTKLLLDEAGNLSINTSTGNYALTVEGTSRFTNTAYVMADLYAGSTAEVMSTTTFVMDGDDAYVHDLLGVGDSLFVENELHVETGGKGLHITPYGSVIQEGGVDLVIDASGNAINLNTNGNGSVSFGTGMVTAGDDITVTGDTNLSGGLYVTGTAIFGTSLVRTGDDVVVGDDLDVAGDLFVTGTTYLGGALNASGTVNISGTTTITNVLDLEGKSANPTHESYLTGAGFMDSEEVFVQGDYAYVISTISDSLTIVDISEKSNPIVMGSIASTTAETLLDDPVDLHVQGNYAYVVASGAVDGLEVIDISDPENPTHHASLKDNIGGAQITSPRCVEVSASYAYICDISQLEIVDISDPGNPQHVSSLAHGTDGALLLNLDDIYISGGYAYAVGYGSDALEIVDISDPYHPKHEGSLANGVEGALLNNAREVHVQGNFAYVAAYSSAALEIIDVSHTASPTHKGSLESLNGAESVHVSGDYAYVAAYNDDALHIVDVTDPSSPYLRGSITDSPGGAQLNGATGLFIQGNYAYLTAVLDHTFEIVDITGAEISTADIGAVKIGTMQVMNTAQFDQSLNIRGGLMVGNEGLLVSGNIGLYAPTSTHSTTATNTISFSNTALFMSNATTSETHTFIFDTDKEYDGNASTTYLLSVRNNGTPAFSVAANGDISASGTVWAQAGGFGTPGTPGDLAEKVDIAIDDEVEPGDVLVVDPGSSDSYRKSSLAYEAAVAGVVSTKPTIVVGDGKTNHKAVMAMVGRVPVKVSTENGSISKGDLLVSATISGHAMRYDPSQDTGLNTVGIVGVALDDFSASSTGKVMALIRTGWINNRHQTIAQLQQDIITLAESSGSSISTKSSDLTTSQTDTGQLSSGSTNLNLNGYYITNVAGIFGKDSLWQIDTKGRFVTKVNTTEGDTSLYGVQSQSTELILSGSDQLASGTKRVEFDSLTREIIDSNEAIKVTVTLTSEASSIYVLDKDATGFTVRESGSGTSDATFDWVVIATRKLDIASPSPEPTSDPIPTDPAPEESVPEPTPEESTPEAPSDPAPVEEIPAEPVLSDPAPAPEEPVAEPAPEPAPAESASEPAPEPAPAESASEPAPEPPEPTPEESTPEAPSDPAPVEEIPAEPVLSDPAPAPEEPVAEPAPEPAPAESASEPAPEPPEPVSEPTSSE